MLAIRRDPNSSARLVDVRRRLAPGAGPPCRSSRHWEPVDLVAAPLSLSERRRRCEYTSFTVLPSGRRREPVDLAGRVRLLFEKAPMVDLVGGPFYLPSEASSCTRIIPEAISPIVCCISSARERTARAEMASRRPAQLAGLIAHPGRLYRPTARAVRLSFAIQSPQLNARVHPESAASGRSVSCDLLSRDRRGGHHFVRPSQHDRRSESFGAGCCPASHRSRIDSPPAPAAPPLNLPPTALLSLCPLAPTARRPARTASYPLQADARSPLLAPWRSPVRLLAHRTLCSSPRSKPNLLWRPSLQGRLVSNASDAADDAKIYGHHRTHPEQVWTPRPAGRKYPPAGNNCAGLAERQHPADMLR